MSRWTERCSAKKAEKAAWNGQGKAKEKVKQVIDRRATSEAGGAVAMATQNISLVFFGLARFYFFLVKMFIMGKNFCVSFIFLLL